jgi:two-component system, chemotaxis family, CheB/CheR fusion protein
MKTDFVSKNKTALIPIKTKEHPFTVVAIGASVGGLEAVSLLLKNLPPDTGMAYIYVQHLNPDHKSLLSTILGKLTKMPVQDIDDMESISPNNVYIIPVNRMIEVVDGHIKLLSRPKNSSIISIDVLFSSLAETHKSNVIGIVLSGNAHDGTLGLKDIKEAGGITFAQDDSAQAGSMPLSAVAAGVVDYVLSPKEIATELVYLSKNKFVKRPIKEKAVSKIIETNNADLNTIFELLRKEAGVDFSHYKIPTIKRRISHKMGQMGIKSVEEYARFLQKNTAEITVLYNSLLINVTSFFRDAEAFEYLKTTLFPKLLKSKTDDEFLRIWVPACSTGEEAYSIAMIINELQEKKSKKVPVQIFATDLSEDSIRVARIGEYAQNDLKFLSEKQVSRYFTKSGDKYRIVKELRDMCIFAPQNILRDPPFSRMDFVSCCNLLIYLDSAAQKKVFSTFHFALTDGTSRDNREGGYLMLGKAETIGMASPLFSQINNKLKIFSRKKNIGVKRIIELLPRFPRSIMANKKINIAAKTISVHPIGIENAIDAVLLSDYMPACAVVNKDMEIVQFRGPVSLYLEHPSGKASLNILKMAKSEFAFELRNAILEAVKTKKTVHKSGIEITINAVLQSLSFEVSPLKIESDEPLLLVVFKVQAQTEAFADTPKSGKDNATLKDQRIKKLTHELNTIRLEINALNEAHEMTYEELQAANEEIVSSNEEYQTLNEELETSKEEIEVTNEELICTNHELQIRNDLLTEAQDYSNAITATIHEPMLILDKHLCVKSANKAFYTTFLVKKEQTEGQLVFNLGNKQWNIPALRTALSSIFSDNKSFENFEVTHTFSEIGEKIMRLNARLIVQKANSEQLILLAIEDITVQKKIQGDLMQTLKEVSDYKYALDASSIVDIVDYKGIMRYVNDNFCKISQYTAEELIGKHYSFLMTGYHSEAFFKDLTETISSGKIWRDEISKKAKDGSIYWVLTTIVPFMNDQGKPYQYVSIRTDITGQKRIEQELIEAKTIAEAAQNKAEIATAAKQQFLSNMSHEIRTPMNAMLGFTRVALKTDLTVKQKEYLTAIKTSGDSLIVLINDILDLAKVDAGKLTFEHKPFKLADSMASMLHLFEPKIQEKNLVLKINYDEKIPEILRGDAVRLHQILLNLLGNAVKFTNVGSITVGVKLAHQDTEKATVEFAVTDTGIGIAADKIDEIFENFHQAANDTTRLFGGTGLGLAIVKQLVKAQDGTIEVESTVDKGSTFSFRLSFDKTDIKVELVADIEALNTEVKNIKVLVVEDMLLNQLLMKTILDDFGFERDIAGNGKIAIEQLKIKDYDIILMDLQMPEMNGFEATQYIRHTLKSNIPIIALTADVTTVDLEKCTAVGMDDYIAKPVDEHILYNKIMGLVKKPKVR